MFHIVLSVDDNYIKYSAVLINNIIKTINKENYNTKAPIYFHIFTDASLSSLSKDNLDILEKNLSKIYPCKIKIHLIDEDIFKKRTSNMVRGKYSAFYRLLIGSVLDKKIEKCLILDVDMLVLSDIRECFYIDLKDNIVAACGHNTKRPSCTSKQGNKNLDFDGFYLNMGFVLVDLKKYREEKIEDKCFDFIENYDIPITPEEYTLNVVLNGRILQLRHEWNLSFSYLDTQRISFKDETKNRPVINYTKADFEQAIKNPKIIHFTYGGSFPKPWQELGKTTNPLHYHPDNNKYRQIWWEFAICIFVYEEHFKKSKIDIEHKFFTNLTTSILPKINENVKLIEKLQRFEKDIMLQNKQEKEQKVFALNSAKTRIRSHLAYKLGQALILNSKSLKGYIRMPYVLSYIKDKHKAEQKAYYEKIFTNPNLKLPPLQSYPDYKEALKEKECITYKLGEALIQNMKRGGALKYLRFMQDVRRIKKEFKLKSQS